MRYREKFTLSRGAKDGSWTDGKFTEGTPTPYEIKANSQPLNGKEVLQLKEGDRVKETLKIYTPSEILENDILTKETTGVAYEAVKVDNRSEGRISHYKAILVKKDTQ